MTEPLLISRQRTILTDLIQLLTERARQEPEIERGFQGRNAATERDFETDYQATIAQFAQEKETAEKQYREACQRTNARFQVERLGVENEYAEASEAIEQRYTSDKKAVQSAYHEVRWTIAAVLEGSKNDAETHLKEVQGRIAEAMQRVASIRKDTLALLHEWKQDPEDFEEAPTETPESND